MCWRWPRRVSDDDASRPVMPRLGSTIHALAGRLIPAAQSVDVRCPPPVMAGEGRPSTTCLRATSEVVDGRPSPAMTGGESGLSAAGITRRILRSFKVGDRFHDKELTARGF